MAINEVILIPGVIVAVNLLFWEKGYDLPIPIGFVSKDVARIKSISTWVSKEWAGFGRKVTEVWCSKRNPKRVDPIEVDSSDVFKFLKNVTKKRATISLRK